MNGHLILNLFHILFVVPLFLYVALSRAATLDSIYWLLLVLGSFVLLYQAYKAVVRYMAGSSYIWVNLIHVLFIAPLIIYIGYLGKKTPRPAYELLALAAFAALGYHSYSILMQLE
jgi:hypothetical protein